MSENVVTPVMQANSKVAGYRRTVQVFNRNRTEAARHRRRARPPPRRQRLSRPQRRLSHHADDCATDVE